MIKVMSKKLVRKTIEMIKELAAEAEETEDEYDSDEELDEEEALGEDEEWDTEDVEYDEEIDDKYYTFWKNFGKSIKLGVIEDSSNRLKLAKFLR
jgi:heat shock protein beta